jgi:hypothetical protein
VTAPYRLPPVQVAPPHVEPIRPGQLAGAVGRAAQLAAGVDEVAARVARARSALGDAAALRDQLLARGAAAWEVAGLERYQRRLRRELAAVRGAQLRAEAQHRGQLDEVDAARERLTLARAEREVIERHFAAWRAERRKLAERRED